MTTINFRPWGHILDDNFANIAKRPDEIRRKSYLLNEAVPCKDWFPEDTHLQLDKDFGLALTDALQNNIKMIVVSEKLKTILDVAAGEYIEFLPVSIDDPRGTPLEAPYFIVNVLRSICCTDTQKSVFEYSSIDKTQIHRFKNLYLIEDKIPEDANIFRLGEKTDTILVREDLIRKIEEAEISGTDFVALEDFGKEFRPVDRLAMIKAIQNSAD